MHPSQELIINEMTSEGCTQSKPLSSLPHTHTQIHMHATRMERLLEPANYSLLYWTLATSEV